MCLDGQREVKSSDDEVAIVYYQGQWYVAVVFGGNAWMAILEGRRYQSYQEALRQVDTYPSTEHGICFYTNYDPTRDRRFVQAMQLREGVEE